MLNRLSRIVTDTHYFLWTFPDKIVVQRRAANVLMSALFPVQEKEYQRPADHDLPAFLQHIVRKIPSTRSDQWHIGLPLDSFSLINFSLPQAAAENIEQAVKYALMRHVPFDLASTYYDYTVLQNNGQLDIAATVALKSEIDDVLNVFATSKLTVRTVYPSFVRWSFLSGEAVYMLCSPEHIEIVIHKDGYIPFQLWFRPSDHKDQESLVQRGLSFVENISDKPDILRLLGQDSLDRDSMQAMQSAFAHTEEILEVPKPTVRDMLRAPYAISMISHAEQQRVKVIRYLQFGAFFFLALSLLAFPAAKLLGSMSYLDRLQHRIDSFQEKVQELQSVRNENKSLEAFFQSLGQKLRNQPQVAMVLKELTEVMPESAWLYTFHFSDARLRIRGEAESATAVLESLENSPLFEKVQYDSPVQKTGSRDRFQIVAHVVL